MVLFLQPARGAGAARCLCPPPCAPRAIFAIDRALEAPRARRRAPWRPPAPSAPPHLTPVSGTHCTTKKRQPCQARALHARCRRRAPQREKAPRALGGSKQAGDGRSARGFGSVTLGAGGARRATQPSGTPTCRRSPSCCRGWGLLRRVWVAAAPGGGLARARGGAGLPGQNLKKKGCCSGAAARAPRHTSRTLTRDTPPRPSPPTPRLPAVPCSWSAKKKNRTYAEFRALEP